MSMPSKGLFRRYKKEVTAYLLLALPILWWGIFFLFAFVRGVYFSFTDLRFDVELISTFNLDNYARLLEDESFLRALSNTAIWTVAMTFANNFVGLLAAFLVFKLARGQKLFLALLFWPTLVSAVTGAHIIKTVFDPSDDSLANVIVKMLGGEPLGWYNDPNIALPTLMLIPMLFGFSMQMMIFYVALLGVPKVYIEAARLETNSQFKILSQVYFPLIINAVSINLVLSIIANIKILGPMQLVGDGMGGPLDSTNTIMLMLYNKGIEGFEMGYASAIGVVALLIIIVLSLLQQRITRKGVDYE